jgi:signal peptidase I
MTVNQLSLIILFVSAIGSLWLHLASLRWGFRWADVATISWLKAFGLLILFTVAGELASLFVNIVLAIALDPSASRIAGYAFVGLRYIIVCLLVMTMYGLGLGRAAKTVLPYVATSLVLISIASFLVRPLAYEAFVIPTNAMAPTLLGEHLEAPCPRCGQPAYGSPPDERSHISPEGLPMICSQELQTVFVKDVPKTVGEGDRITVFKRLTPQRWDLIVFRYPGDPSVNYVKRLVGLPGEKLEIRDGAVWINGEKMEPPDSIRGIRYSPTIDHRGREFSGPGSVPVELGPDEYFVLGDFVDQSSDSRFWERGAPGHPPYAVPTSHLVGVVINIYWPPSRWTGFR